LRRLLVTSALWVIGYIFLTALSPAMFDSCSCCNMCPPVTDDWDAGCPGRCCPLVACPSDQRVDLGQVVVLQGGVIMYPEDEQVCVDEKGTLEYQWEQVDGPQAELKDADQIQASFVATKTGSYTFRFRAVYPLTDVNTERLSTDWCYTGVTVGGCICGPPFADAGYDQTLATSPGEPQTVHLDGTRSYAVRQEGCDLNLIRHSWTMISGPAGSAVFITDSDQARASVELLVAGEHEFQLEVQDDGGTDGRTDTATDTVIVTLVEKEVCEADLEVTAINASTGETLADVLVTVVDALGDAHTATTDVEGVAVFDSLADGDRQSITAACDDLVPPIGGVGGEDRPRFETTTVMNHCAGRITVPMRYTASGERAGDWGTVVAKVPSTIFNMLPHSWHCAGDCEDDDDCNENYYCELDEDTPCGPHPPEVPQGTCTPRSVLPFFSLGDPFISGQVRFAMVLPVLPVGKPIRDIPGTLLTRPIAEESLWPGNFATDDLFLNGLAPSIGLDPWGDACINTEDCPDDNICEQDPWGEYRCKDRSSLRNIGVDVPAGPARKLMAVVGILDLSLIDILPWMLPWLTGDSGSHFFGFLKSCLANAQMHTLLVCPLDIDVAAGGETDISPQLSGLSKESCWQVDYQSKDTVVPFVDPYNPDPDVCMSDNDCCASWGDCGWPQSGWKCLDDPYEPSRKKCFMPLFRVEIISGDSITLLPPASGFDPYAAKSDDRLCSWVPDSAPFEVMCESYTPGYYVPCDPRNMQDLDVPTEHECSFPYGLSIASLDFPPGHTALPEGGRVVVGFGLNHTPSASDRDPEFLVPSLRNNGLEGAAISVTQLIHRNNYDTKDGGCVILPGLVGMMSSVYSNAPEIQMEGSLPFLEIGGIADPGMDVKVTFIAEDPTVFPPTLARVYTEAAKMRPPVSGTHTTPYEIEITPAAGHHLIGLVVEKVDRVDDEPVVDPLWRIYLPADTASVMLPDSVSPFKTGDEVQITPWASSFPVPFDYDLFQTDLILKDQAAYSEDSYRAYYQKQISFP